MFGRHLGGISEKSWKGVGRVVGGMWNECGMALGGLSEGLPNEWGRAENEEVPRMSERASRDLVNAALKIAAANYEPRQRSKRKHLLPLKEGIAALREKRASFRIIAALLTQQGVPVSPYAVRTFCQAEIDGRRKHRGARRAPDDSRRQARPNGEPPQNFTTTLAERKKSTPEEAQSTSAARKRGPRIADPSTL